MKITNFIIPALGLSLGAILILPTQQADAWSTIGGSLGHGQRDFRTYDNFADSATNNNQTPDPMFPGAQGAVMAIWKGVIEWSSIAHGDGSGDPTQGVLGSGGGNFDPSHQGEATSSGNSNQNIHSPLSGGSGGVLAYCETPISDGWRIRYYEDWTWADGPSSIGGNQFDLQAVSCHEYGHALGLGHSTSNSATMAPSIANGATGQRSINSDDMGGVQAVYGSISGSKPVITGVSISGSTIQVSGSNFDSTGNQIWFTQAGSGGNGTPIKVTGLSSNGSTVSATIPATAGPGDILVRSNGTSHGDLSNAWPTDLQGGGGGCPDPVSYCGTSPNSVGSGAIISYAGSSSMSSNNLTLLCSGLVPNTPGLYYYGPNQTAVLLGEGVRCVDGNLTRLDVQVADFLGTSFDSLDLNSPPFSSGLGAVSSGDVRHFQYWYRDVPGGTNGYNLSDALTVTFCP